MARMTNFRSAALATGNAINNSAYDNVKVVADSIGDVNAIGELVRQQNVDLKSLASVLTSLGSATSEHLSTLANIDLSALVEDLKKGNYLGNRKLDIDLALNVEGITPALIVEDPATAASIWAEKSSNVSYSSATITFVDGVVVELPFLVDNSPTVITNTAGLLTQLNRTDVVNAVVQVDEIYSVTVLDNTVYTVTVDNIPFTFTSGVNSTRGSIITGLTNALNEGDNKWLAHDNGTSITLVAKTAGVGFLTTVDSNLQVQTIIENVVAGNYPTAFSDKLINTAFNSFTEDVVSSKIRFFDVIGTNSNIERVQLHTSDTATSYIVKDPIYYWSQSTSSLEVLSNRAGDIIKIGNYIDNIISLSTNISQVLEIQDRIPQLIDTYDTNGTANGDMTIYNKLPQLDAIYQQLQAIITLYEDMHTGGLNSIQVNAANIVEIQTIASNIVPNLAAILESANNANIASTQASIATEKANIATEKANIATEKANTILGLSGNQITQTLAAGSQATVYYNASNGKLTFGIPQGPVGPKGDSFTVNSIGNTADRSLYDNQIKGFSFLDIDTSKIYFKISSTNGDWSLGSPFGKGDTGNGISSITFTSTTDSSGLAGKASATDTYTITFTDGSITTFDITNGAVPTKEALGLSNVDNTSDLDKPISTATQDALDNKVDKYNYVYKNTDYTANSNDFIYADTTPIAQIDTISNVTALDNTAYDITINGITYTYTSPTPIAQVDTISNLTAVDNTVYPVTINGTTYTYTTGVGETVGAILTGIANAITDPNVTAVASSTEVTITANTAGTGFTATTSSVNFTLSNTVANVPSATAANVIEGIASVITSPDVNVVNKILTLDIVAKVAGVPFTSSTTSTDFVLANTVMNNSGSFTVTLPSNPSNNDTVVVIDNTSNFGNNPLTIARNGKTIMGQNKDIISSIKGTSLEFIFNGNEWRLKSSASSVAAPTMTIPSLTVNEFTVNTFTIDNYDPNVIYNVSAINGSVSISNDKVTYVAPEEPVTNGTDIVSIYYTIGTITSEIKHYNFTIIAVPTLADTTIQVLDFTNTLSSNDGFNLV